MPRTYLIKFNFIILKTALSLLLILTIILKYPFKVKTIKLSIYKPITVLLFLTKI
jgi:hypothetical protein